MSAALSLTGLEYVPVGKLVSAYPNPHWPIFISLMVASGLGRAESVGKGAADVLIPLELIKNFIASSFFTNTPDPQPSVVAPFKTYLMRDEHTGLVKIGRSANPKQRETTLQSTAPLVAILGILNIDVERELHLRYRAQRVRGEWFQLCPEEVDAILTQYGFTKPS